ncbi:hypothetical protein KR200_004978 [Drosophila serrata]|nr:hypothetical protein KR200_004978 [Drosophila serrata]
MDTKSNDDSAGSDSLDKSMQIKCVMVETTGSTVDAVDASAECEALDNCSRDSAAETGAQVGKAKATKGAAGTGAAVGKQEDQKTDAATGARGEGDSPESSQSPGGRPASNSSSTACTAFETKVKLISQNLKETTLAETTAGAASASASASTPAAVSVSASTSTSASSSSSLLEPQPLNNSSTDESTSSSSGRVKKVRFHPDVKENDGGNWVKKKRRAAQTKRAASSSTGTTSDGMDLDGEAEDAECDEDQEEEPEEEFDLAKTIAEAEDYLKQHPLTFVRRIEQNGERPQDGLLNIEDMSTHSNDYEEEVMPGNREEDFYRHVKPENGIERVLGKETKAGKKLIKVVFFLLINLPYFQVEFLLRYENHGGLFWKSEEFIRRTCPTLLKAYEKNRERRQQRLMHHVAKRQSLRQRYTDF